MNSAPANESYMDAVLFDRAGRLASVERRRNFRAPLHWTLYLACSGSGYPIRTTTRDINKDGFYCLLDHPVRPGERIECNIAVPKHKSQDPDDVVYLRCRAQVDHIVRILRLVLRHRD